MKRALEEIVIEGVETNIDFLFEIIKNPNFIREILIHLLLKKNIKYLILIKYKIFEINIGIQRLIYESFTKKQLFIH